MRKLRAVFLRLAGLFHRQRRAAEFDAELESNLQMQIEDNLRAGMSPEEARYAALRKFGNVTRVKEDAWNLWSFVWLEQLWQDFRYGLRMLARNPAFTVVSVLTLALGIGANSTIFSLIDALFLRPLPVSNAGELVDLRTVVPNHERNLFSYAMAKGIAHDAKSFASVAPWSGPVVPLEVNGESAPGAVNVVTADYFRTLGVRPLIGRLFGPEDFKAGSGTHEGMAVISYGFWQARYGGNPAVLGKTLKVNGHERTIVGVTAKGYLGPMVGVSIDVWVPMTPPRTTEEALRSRKDQDYWLTARLRPGVSIAKARAEMEAIWPTILQSTLPAQLDGERKEQFLRQRIRLEPAAAGFPSTSLLQFERPLWVLFAGVGLLLLIVCLNIASLLVARAAGRRHEMGIRVALGATRRRLTRQVISEGLMLSFGGAILGLPLAFAASGLLARFVWTGFFPVALDLRPDWRILLFTGAVACLTGTLFSLLPAWHARAQDPANLMQYRAGRFTRGGAVWKAGKVTVVAQVGLSLVLIQCASLFTRNLAGLHALDLGFKPDKVLGLWLQPKPGENINSDRATYYHLLMDELARQPGVRSVSLSHDEPIWRVSVKWTTPVARGSGGDLSGSRVDADEHTISPNFFGTMGIHLLQGRDFSFQDDPHAPAVAIISRSLAQRLFPAGDAVGQSITVFSESGNQSRRVIGVVNDANLFFARNQKPPALYLPFFQQSTPMVAYIEMKTYGDPGTVVAATRRQVEAAGRDYVFLTETLQQALDNTLVNDRILALLSDVFGVLALLLVAIGLYGVMSYSVAGRTAEIGVRTALGAEPSSIFRLVLSDSVLIIAIGVAMSLPAVFGASKLVSKMLFGLSPADPVSLLGAILTVVGTALLATYIPARRATRVDPMVALRYE